MKAELPFLTGRVPQLKVNALASPDTAVCCWHFVHLKRANKATFDVLKYMCAHNLATHDALLTEIDSNCGNEFVVEGLVGVLKEERRLAHTAVA